MKVVPPKEQPNKRNTEVLLPLVSKPTAHTKSNSVTFELRSEPGNNQSAKYGVTILKIQGGEDIATLTQWIQDYQKVVNGLGFGQDQGEQIHKIVVGMLSGNPANMYIRFIQATGNANKTNAINAVPVADRNNIQPAEQAAIDQIRNRDWSTFINRNNVEDALKGMIQEMMPTRALARVKRYFRRECRKPTDMKVREYFQHLERVNMVEIPSMPPLFSNEQMFSNDELLDILLYGTPKAWQREMDRQGFDPYETGNTISDVVAFMEQIELSEETPTKEKGSNNNNSSKKKDDGRIPRKKSKNKAKYFCSHHGENYSHDTKDCRIVKDKAGGSDNKKGGYRNKTWTRKSEESTSSSKKELAVFISKHVKAGVKKELASLSKKRKTEESTESEDDATLDLNAIEEAVDDINMASDMESVTGEVSC